MNWNIALLVMAALGGCANSKGSRDQVDLSHYPIAGTGSACLTEAALSTHMAAANDGELRSARAVTIHFDLCTDDRRAALDWMKKSAMLGDKDFAISLVVELQRLGDDAEREEAKKLAHEWGLEHYIDEQQ